MSAHRHKTIRAEDARLPAGLGKMLPIAGAGAAVVGLGGTFALADDHHANLFAYLTAFMFWLSIALGSLFFVMIFSLTRSGWFVSVRRLAENFMMTLPVFALLFIPIAMNMDSIYHWTDPHVLETDALLQWKSPYLNKGRFLAFSGFYLAAWAGLAWLFYSQSVKQDSTRDHKISERVRAFAAPGIAVGALTLTFAAFDWNMSIDFHWFSTMYGVIYFAGSFMACFAVLALVSIWLNRSNSLGGAVTVEHYHGIGKMMFGMNCFWAYVSFSQLILIWYADIPEETLWFAKRIEGSWWLVSMTLLFGHFIVPFFFLMSHHIKRNPLTLALGAGWLLLMHYVDVYWMIMPNVYHGNAHFGLVEVLSLVGVGGVFVAVAALLANRTPLVPVGDPRLPESLAFEN